MRFYPPPHGLAPAAPATLLLPALAMAWLAAGPTGGCLAMASVALLAAAAERRTTAMLAAAGIAAGSRIEGMALLPLAIGWAIAGRAGWRSWAMLPFGWAFAMVTLGMPQMPPPVLGLWALAAALPAGAPDLFALLGATLAGAGAWAAAANAARLPDSRERMRRAMLAGLGFALLAPVSTLALVLPLAVAVHTRRAGAALAIGAAGASGLAGQPLAGTLAIAGVLLAAVCPRRGAANDNMPLRPLPYLP